VQHKHVNALGNLYSAHPETASLQSAEGDSTICVHGCFADATCSTVCALQAGGIGAMELVAMELKGAGCYLSRSLSWAVSSNGWMI
jgi:hypothetical protein